MTFLCQTSGPNGSYSFSHTIYGKIKEANRIAWPYWSLEDFTYLLETLELLCNVLSRNATNMVWLVAALKVALDVLIFAKAISQEFVLAVKRSISNATIFLLN